MKNSRRCSKCGGSDIVRIPDQPRPLRQREQYLYFQL